MRKRTLLRNIFIVVLMISIVFVLLAFFEVFPESAQSAILFASMSLALISVALVDIVFPLIDNASRFKNENSYKVKTVIKIVLFLVAVAFLLFTVKGIGFFKTQFLGIALFCVAYLAQFFIDLDKNKKNQGEEEDDEDAAEDRIEDEEEFDNNYIDDAEEDDEDK